MTETGAHHATRVVPLMRYRDLPSAITWLSEAFGFEAHYTASDEDGKLIYAQMVFGNGMVMLGPVRDSDFDDLLSQPDEIGGTETQSCYLVVEDIESHFQRAKEAGADIALDVQSDETGGRAYSCRDCEGHLWNFGTFNPWQSATGAVSALTPGSGRIQAGPISMARSAAAAFAGLAIAGVAIGVYSSHQQPKDRISNIRVVDPDDMSKKPQVGLPTAPVRVVAALRKQLQQERVARREAEQRLAKTRRDLALEKARSQDAVSTTRRVSEELSETRGAEQAALATIERLRGQHTKDLRVAKASVEELQSLIDVERAAKEKALKAAEDIKYELVLERQLRQQAERDAKTAETSARVAKRQLKAKNPALTETYGTPAKEFSGTKSSPAETKPTVAVRTPASTSALPENDKTTDNQSEATTGTTGTEAPASNKVSTIEPPVKKPELAPKSETKPASETKKATPKRRKRIVRKAKKKAPPKKKSSNGIAKGWPYNTW